VVTLLLHANADVNRADNVRRCSSKHAFSDLLEMMFVPMTHIVPE
jgi:hypothetical protein